MMMLFWILFLVLVVWGLYRLLKTDGFKAEDTSTSSYENSLEAHCCYEEGDPSFEGHEGRIPRSQR